MVVNRQHRWKASASSASRLSCNDLLAHYSLHRWPSNSTSLTTARPSVLQSQIEPCTPISDVDVRVVRNPYSSIAALHQQTEREHELPDLWLVTFRSIDEATRSYLRDYCTDPPIISTSLRWMYSRLLYHVGGYSATDANAKASYGHMHVLSTAQTRLLLGMAHKKLLSCPVDNSDAHDYGRLLDVGAGSGRVTKCLEPLFSSVCVTEISLGAIESLKRNYPEWIVYNESMPSPEKLTKDGCPCPDFDVISCLNLLDRCTHPLALLSSLVRLLSISFTEKALPSLLLLAVVLPFHGGVERTNRAWDPQSEFLPVSISDSRSFEACAYAFVRDVLCPAGLETLVVSRVPYLSQSSRYYLEDFAVLDDAIFICRAS